MASGLIETLEIVPKHYGTWINKDATYVIGMLEIALNFRRRSAAHLFL